MGRLSPRHPDLRGADDPLVGGARSGATEMDYTGEPRLISDDGLMNFTARWLLLGEAWLVDNIGTMSLLYVKYSY